MRRSLPLVFGILGLLPHVACVSGNLEKHRFYVAVNGPMNSVREALEAEGYVTIRMKPRAAIGVLLEAVSKLVKNPVYTSKYKGGAEIDELGLAVSARDVAIFVVQMVRVGELSEKLLMVAEKAMAALGGGKFFSIVSEGSKQSTTLAKLSKLKLLLSEVAELKMAATSVEELPTRIPKKLFDAIDSIEAQSLQNAILTLIADEIYPHIAGERVEIHIPVPLMMLSLLSVCDYSILSPVEGIDEYVGADIYVEQLNKAFTELGKAYYKSGNDGMRRAMEQGDVAFTDVTPPQAGTVIAAVIKGVAKNARPAITSWLETDSRENLMDKRRGQEKENGKVDNSEGGAKDGGGGERSDLKGEARRLGLLGPQTGKKFIVTAPSGSGTVAMSADALCTLLRYSDPLFSTMRLLALFSS